MAVNIGILVALAVLAVAFLGNMGLSRSSKEQAKAVRAALIVLLLLFAAFAFMYLCFRNNVLAVPCAIASVLLPPVVYVLALRASSGKFEGSHQRKGEFSIPRGKPQLDRSSSPRPTITKIQPSEALVSAAQAAASAAQAAASAAQQQKTKKQVRPSVTPQVKNHVTKEQERVQDELCEKAALDQLSETVEEIDVNEEGFQPIPRAEFDHFYWGNTTPSYQSDYVQSVADARAAEGLNDAVYYRSADGDSSDMDITQPLSPVGPRRVALPVTAPNPEAPRGRYYYDEADDDVIDIEEPVVSGRYMEVETAPAAGFANQPVDNIDPDFDFDIEEPTFEPEPVAVPGLQIAPEPEPMIEPEPEPSVVTKPEPAIEPEPEPMVEPEPVVEPAIEPEPVFVPEPEPMIEPEPVVEPVIEPEPERTYNPELVTPVAAEPVSVVDDSYEDDDEMPEVQPELWDALAFEPELAVSHKPAAAVEPAVVLEPEPQPEPVVVAEPEPEPEPVFVPAPEPEPVYVLEQAMPAPVEEVTPVISLDVAPEPEETPFEKMVHKAEFLQVSGKLLLAARLYRDASGMAPSIDESLDLRLKEVTCYVKLGDIDRAKSLAAEIKQSKVLTKDVRMKLMALEKMK